MQPPTAIHKLADYYEPRLRVAIMRAMKQLRKQVSVHDIALAISLRHTRFLETATIKKALEPATKIVRDAVRQGGKLGAERINHL